MVLLFQLSVKILTATLTDWLFLSTSYIENILVTNFNPLWN